MTADAQKCKTAHLILHFELKQSAKMPSSSNKIEADGAIIKREGHIRRPLCHASQHHHHKPDREGLDGVDRHVRDGDADRRGRARRRRTGVGEEGGRGGAPGHVETSEGALLVRAGTGRRTEAAARGIPRWRHPETARRRWSETSSTRERSGRLEAR